MIGIPNVLMALQERGVRSVMVEGGAKVIRSFLSAAAHGESKALESSGTAGRTSTRLVDALVVTTAPILVGEAGVGYASPLLADTVSPTSFVCGMWR